MILTHGEKMVWAAAFVDEFMPGFKEPGENCIDTEKWEQYEIDLAAMAAESACGAVCRMRDAKERVEHGFGEDSDVTQMIRAMLGDDG